MDWYKLPGNGGRNSKNQLLDATILQVKMILDYSLSKLMVINHCLLSKSMLMMEALLEHQKQSKMSLRHQANNSRLRPWVK
jgi:hypothetical protein